jgi:chromosome segregation ATPase
MCEALAHEASSLRAENERLRDEIVMLNGIADMHMKEKARAERAEELLGKIQALHSCSQEMVPFWCERAVKRAERAEADLGSLNGRIGLFAAKWFAISDNLSTDETFAAMETEIVDTANKYVALMGDNEQLKQRAERAEAEVARLREEIDSLTSGHLNYDLLDERNALLADKERLDFVEAHPEIGLGSSYPKTRIVGFSQCSQNGWRTMEFRAETYRAAIDAARAALAKEDKQ